jgi:hypothetical protein
MNEIMETDTVFHKSKRSPRRLAKQLGIDEDQAQTVLNDVVPVLKRKFDLLFEKSASSKSNIESTVSDILTREVPKVLSNYALSHLQNKKAFLLYLIANMSPQITDLQAKYLIDKRSRKSVQTLEDQLTAQLGIPADYISDFKKKVIPKIRKDTKTFYRKKLQTEGRIRHPEESTQFIIDNVFIDEFENQPFIRSQTDESNRAILAPEVKRIAIKLIMVWMTEVGAV